MSRRFKERSVRFDAMTASTTRASCRCRPSRGSSAMTAWFVLHAGRAGDHRRPPRRCRRARGRAGKPDGAPGDPRGRLPRPHRSGAARLGGSDALAVHAHHRQPRAHSCATGRRCSGHWRFRSSSSSCSGRSSPRAADANYKVGWVDEDGSAASAQLRQGFGSVEVFTLVDDPSRDAALASFRKGDVRAVIVVPKGYGAAVGSAQAGGSAGRRAGAICRPGLTDPSQSTTTGVIGGIVNAVVVA